MNEDLVSVIIPVYNSETVLDRAVESVLNQTHNNTQLILVEGFSKDKSPQMCKAYSEKYDNIKVIYHDKNYGCEKARNDGIDASDGSYFMFLDSDDALPITSIDDLLYNIRRYQSDIVFAGYTNIVDGNEKLVLPGVQERFYTRKETANMLLESLSLPIISCVGSKLYRTEVVRKNRIYGDIKCRHNDDLAFTIDVLKVSNGISVLNTSVYNYFIRNGSMAYSYREGLFSSLMNARNKMCELAMAEGCYDNNKSKWLRMKFNIFLEACENEIEYKKDYNATFNKYVKRPEIKKAVRGLLEEKNSLRERMLLLFTKYKMKGMLKCYFCLINAFRKMRYK